MYAPHAGKAVREKDLRLKMTSSGNIYSLDPRCGIETFTEKRLENWEEHNFVASNTWLEASPLPSVKVLLLPIRVTSFSITHVGKKRVQNVESSSSHAVSIERKLLLASLGAELSVCKKKFRPPTSGAIRSCEHLVSSKINAERPHVSVDSFKIWARIRPS